MLPKRKTVDNSKALFAIEDYISEIRIEEDAPIIGKTIRELLEDVEGKIQILGINRNGHQLHAPGATFKFKAGDTLMIEVDGDDLKELLEIKGVVLGGEASSADKSDDMSTQISIKEVVLADYSPLINHTAASLKMRSRYGVNLLAIARRDRIMRKQMDNIKFKSGDVLLIQGPTDLMGETIRQFGGLPLAQRDLGLNYKTSIPLALSIFTLGVSLVVFDVLSVQVAFSLTAMAMVISGILPIKQVYTSIDWPVIVLLAAMIPVGESLEQTGGAALLADSLMEWQALFPSWFMLGILLTVTMLLSGVINNAATVVLMAPVALSLAQGLGHSIDPYLMAVAVGSSGAFLTPIGHQSNTLVMGPGGYRFTDYLILGLPISVIMVLVGVPLIMIFWPL
jgi:di/tricarboxylate transporter